MNHAERTPREESMLHLIPKSALGGTAVATTGAMTHNEVLALAGLLFTVLSFLVNLFFQYQKHKREVALNDAQIAVIKKN